MKNKRLNIILITSAILLLIPLIAMQFTEEVNWSLSDFIVAGVLLVGAGLFFELVMRKTNKTMYRMIAGLIILLILILIWAELAVGIFDNSLTGQ